MPRKKKHDTFFIAHGRKLVDTAPKIRGPKILYKYIVINVMTKTTITHLILCLITVNIFGWIILWVGVWGGWCPVCFRMFSNILRLFPLDASSTLPPSVITTKNVPDIAKYPLEYKIIPDWEPLLYIAHHHAFWENIRNIPTYDRNKKKIHISKWFRKKLKG